MKITTFKDSKVAWAYLPKYESIGDNKIVCGYGIVCGISDLVGCEPLRNSFLHVKCEIVNF